jgi:hypothetical protein
MNDLPRRHQQKERASSRRSDWIHHLKGVAHTNLPVRSLTIGPSIAANAQCSALQQRGKIPGSVPQARVHVDREYARGAELVRAQKGHPPSYKRESGAVFSLVGITKVFGWWACVSVVWGSYNN